VKTHGRISNLQYRELTRATDRTALRDLADLLAKDVLSKVGRTGRATHYVLSDKSRHEPDKPDIP
jgi:ATP-dependent DNA helicase RecG